MEGEVNNGEAKNLLSLAEQNPQCTDREQIEIELLLEGMFRMYGYDFRNYSCTSLRRLIHKFMQKHQILTIAELQHKVIYECDYANDLMRNLAIQVTWMFRDPNMYQAFRRKVLPILRQQPKIRIWHAGCSTGEEVYSMAILLKEEGLYDRTMLYATDLTEDIVEKAKAGRYPLHNIGEYESNYLKAGGRRSLFDYVAIDNANRTLLMDSSLQQNIVFAKHNLATDTSFNCFDVIFCRNVMIYFNESLFRRVLELFKISLAPNGLIVLGSSESINRSGCYNSFKLVDPIEKFYQKT